MHEYSSNASEVEFRAAIVEDALRPGGVANDIALSALERSEGEDDPELSAHEAGLVIMPPKKQGEANDARWVLAETAKDAVKAGAAEHEETIFELADRLDMRRANGESISGQDLARIMSDRAIFLAEGGANRTSVTRRGIAIDAVRQLYGENAVEATIYQSGSERAIPRERSGKPNSEYKVATEIAGRHLPAEGDDSLTEFGLNVASALQDGYRIVAEARGGEAARTVVYMQKDGYPNLLQFQPYADKGGMDDIMTSLAHLNDLDGKQIVVGTNGQYRPYAEQQIAKWASQNGIDMEPPVAVGDEAGYTVEHDGKVLETAKRPALTYLNEMVVLERKYEADREA